MSQQPTFSPLIKIWRSLQNKKLNKKIKKNSIKTLQAGDFSSSLSGSFFALRNEEEKRPILTKNYGKSGSSSSFMLPHLILCIPCKYSVPGAFL